MTQSAAPSPPSPALRRHKAAVSVIMPAHQAAATLARAIDSVRAQRWEDWELLVSDDGSGDETAAIAAAAASLDPRIRLLRAAESAGAAVARNRALDAAEGRFIAFLDADDLWLPEKLSRQIPFLEETGAALGYTGFWRRRPDGRQQRVHVPESVDHARLLRGNVIGCLTAVYDARAIGKVPMRRIRRRQDFALWLDILRMTPVARGIDEPLAVYNIHQGSLSANKIAATRDSWRMYRDVVGLGRIEAARCLTAHLWQRLAGARPGRAERE